MTSELTVDQRGRVRLSSIFDHSRIRCIVGIDSSQNNVAVGHLELHATKETPWLIVDFFAVDGPRESRRNFR